MRLHSIIEINELKKIRTYQLLIGMLIKTNLKNQNSTQIADSIYQIIQSYFLE